MLFAVLAGAIGDLVDRRRFLLIAQGGMLARTRVAAGTAAGDLARLGESEQWRGQSARPSAVPSWP
jgi:hypothetical protein